MEGFGNQDKAKVHLAAAKYQQRSTVSVHENVPDYDEEWYSLCLCHLLAGVFAEVTPTPQHREGSAQNLGSDAVIEMA